MTRGTQKRAGDLQEHAAASNEEATAKVIPANAEGNNAYQLYWEDSETEKPVRGDESHEENAYLKYWESTERY